MDSDSNAKEQKRRIMIIIINHYLDYPSQEIRDALQFHDCTQIHLSQVDHDAIEADPGRYDELMHAAIERVLSEMKEQPKCPPDKIAGTIAGANVTFVFEFTELTAEKINVFVNDLQGVDYWEEVVIEWRRQYRKQLTERSKAELPPYREECTQ